MSGLYSKARGEEQGCQGQRGGFLRWKDPVSRSRTQVSDAGYKFGHAHNRLGEIRRVATYVRNQRPGLRTIIWDDMLRSIPEEILRVSGVGLLVEPMVWVYVEDVDRFIDPLTWAQFASVFDHMWVASAFKGAFGERLYGANVARHLGNSLGWLEVMMRESRGSNEVKFRGIALTGEKVILYE